MMDMQVGSKRDLPVDSNLSTPHGVNPLNVQEGHGLMPHKNNGRLGTSTTIIIVVGFPTKIRKKPLEGFTPHKEDECLSLAVGTMTNNHTTNALTIGLRPLRRPWLPSKVRCMVTHNGMPPWDRRWPPLDNSKTNKCNSWRCYC